MQPFNKWLELREGFPANYAPTPRMGVGGDPLLSALNKINKGQGHMPFDGNFTNGSVIQTRLGLDAQELQALNNAKLIVPDEMGGVNIDKNRFNLFYQKFMRMSPDQR